MKDLELDLWRYGFGETSTLGKLGVDGVFECYTLEDERRSVKVQAETCISPGRYQIKFRVVGEKTQDYAKRFPAIHRGMLWLQDVKDFLYIYIHIGNKESQTEGCILVGDVPIILPSGEFEIAQSTAAYVRLYEKIIAAVDQGRKIWITIHEKERPR